VRYRDLDAKRDFDWSEGGDLLAQYHDANDDYAIMLIQQLLEQLNRSPHVARGSSLTGNALLLPGPGAGGFFRWADDASGIVLDTLLGLDVVPAGTIMQTVTNVAAVRLLSAPAGQAAIWALGTDTISDGGGGLWYWDATATEDDNKGTVIEVAGGGATGRYRRAGALQSSRIKPRWFGAKGDGLTNDRLAVIATRAYCKAVQGNNNNPSLDFGAGQYILDYIPGDPDHNGPIMLNDESHGLTWLGDNTAAMAQGSVRPTCVLRAGPNTTGAMIELEVEPDPLEYQPKASYISFVGLHVENGGNATHFLNMPSRQTGHLLFDRFSASGGANGPASAQFSSRVIYAQNFNYTHFKTCHFALAAPVDIELDGNGTGNGTARLSFEDLHITSQANDHTFFKLVNGSIDSLEFKDWTCDAQGAGALTMVDTRDIGLTTALVPNTVGALLITGVGESDDISGNATARLFRLKRCRAVDINGLQVTGNGAQTAFMSIEDCAVNWGANDVQSIAGPIIEEFGTLNRVNDYGPGLTRVGTTHGLLAAGSTANYLNLEVIPTTTLVPITGHRARGSGLVPMLFRALTVGAVYTFYRPLYNENPSGSLTPGATYNLLIINGTGGVMGVPVFDPADFKMQAAAIVAPANGKARGFTFFFDGAWLWEIGERMAGDIG
jgi:hypothetical protein